MSHDPQLLWLVDDIEEQFAAKIDSSEFANRIEDADKQIVALTSSLRNLEVRLQYIERYAGGKNIGDGTQFSTEMPALLNQKLDQSTLTANTDLLTNKLGILESDCLAIEGRLRLLEEHVGLLLQSIGDEL